MTPDTPVTVAVDAMGGDHGPDVVVRGARDATERDPSLRVLLAGPQTVVAPFLDGDGPIQGLPAEDVLSMDEQPVKAVRSRPDASMVVACRAVAEGRAQAVFTAGNTGAAMAASLVTLGRIPNVKRPALGAVIPTADRPAVLLDIGANADCRPEHLVQFAHMGAAYSSVTLGVASPTIGLLNIGEEPSKGSRLALEAHVMMADSVPTFEGNVEGHDIASSPVDVIVTDGFTGNVALKLLEGTAKALFGQIADALTRDIVTKLAATVLRPGLTGLKRRLDPDRYGGAPLLGLRGVSVVGHGGSREMAIASGVNVAARAAREDLTGRIERAISS